MEIIHENKPNIDYIAQVLGELLSRQLDADITITATPKEESFLKTK